MFHEGTGANTQNAVLGCFCLSHNLPNRDGGLIIADANLRRTSKRVESPLDLLDVRTFMASQSICMG
jgi:hypothetical protein